MMKFSLIQLLILPIFFLASCSDNEEAEPTIVITKDQQSQTAYADDVERTIRFTAVEDWHTEINYNAVKAFAVTDPWIVLDPPSGTAGAVTLKVTLSTNYTGSNRQATIRIICGHTVIVVTIEQKGTDESGKVPDEEELPEPMPAQRLKQVILQEDGIPFYTDFTYDSEERIVKVHSYRIVNGEKQDTYKQDYTYSDKQITEHFTGWDEGYVGQGITIYTLEEGRIVRSSTQDDESSYEEFFQYGSDGRLTVYKENHPFNISYQQVYTWKNEVIVSMVYTGSSDTIVYHYEYYDPSEIPSASVSFPLPYIIDELNVPDMALFGMAGKPLTCFIKKVIVTGDKWNKDNGIAAYRYETDSAGYVTKVYRTWTPEGGVTEPEAVIYEFKYE